MLKKIIVILTVLAVALTLASCAGVSVTSEEEAETGREQGEFAPPDGVMPDFNGEMPDFNGEMPSFPNGEMPDFEGGMPGGFPGMNGAANGAESADKIDASEQFTDRDLEQTADLASATKYTLKDNENVTLTSAGVYVFTGKASDCTITVDAGDEDKVQIVLDGVTVTNSDFPAIYVKNADKVFVTTTDSKNSLTVTGSFKADGDTNTDAVIFSKDDLVLNGVGTLTVKSTDNGITSKDDLKITGGNISVDCKSDALEANDSIRIADGNIAVKTDKDGLHAEYDEDGTVGYIFIGGGTLDVTAGDDAIHATTVCQVDGGNITVNAAEGLEATQVVINGGSLDISASDDGINAARKSDSLGVIVEINGGDIKIKMGQGDTDGVDSNGNIVINGGTIDVTGQSAFDYDGAASLNGGTVIINGETVDELPNQFGGMEPGGGGGMMPGGNGGMTPGGQGPGGNGGRGPGERG